MFSHVITLKSIETKISEVPKLSLKKHVLSGGCPNALGSRCLGPPLECAAGEVLVNPVLWHVAYTADPTTKSVMQAFCQFAMGGLPNAISAALTQATKNWTPNNLNDGNLPMVYVVNVIFCLAGCAVYVLVTRKSGSKGNEWLSSEDSGEETSDSEMQ